jgi:hypothetical protein
MPKNDGLLFLALRKDKFVKEALDKLINQIGGRSGLSELTLMFTEMDTDGSGDLSPEEFGAGLKKFGINLSDAEVCVQ